MSLNHYSAFLPTNSCFEDPDQNNFFFHEIEMEADKHWQSEYASYLYVADN